MKGANFLNFSKNDRMGKQFNFWQIYKMTKWVNNLISGKFTKWPNGNPTRDRYVKMERREQERKR